MNKIKKFYSTQRVQKITISTLVAILFLGWLTLMTSRNSSEPEPADKARVSITLVSKDIKEKAKTDVEIVVKGDVEVLTETEMIVEKASMTINTPTVLTTKLDAGEYTVDVTSSPIERDGSMYKIPDKTNKLIVSKEDVEAEKIVNMDIVLERIPVEDMTKEQLDVAIERINKEAPEQKELVTELEKRKETAVSDEASVNDVKQESKASDTPKVDETPKEETKPNQSNSGSSNSGSSGGNSSGGSTSNNTPAPPVNTHTHNWVPNMVTIPAVPAQGYNETIPAVTKTVGYFVYSDGCKIEITGNNEIDRNAMYNHDLTHGIINYTTRKETVVITPEQTRWVETSPAQPERQEQQGYKCSCGATK